jgi:hypothetical protein
MSLRVITSIANGAVVIAACGPLLRNRQALPASIREMIE